MKRPKYHSALKTEEVDAVAEYNPVIFEDGSIAFHYDVNDHGQYLHDNYNNCDVLYTELPWKAGFEEFNSRAGVSGVSYLEYLESIAMIVSQTIIPTVIIAGVTEGKYLPDPTAILNITLNGAPAKAYCYNSHVFTMFKNHKKTLSAKQLLIELGGFYSRIGDFCCGYGRAGKIFREAGKTFVMSDYNPKCIGYIKNNFDGKRV